MTVLIIEDEALAAERLKRMLRQLDESIEVLGILDTVHKAVGWLKNNDHPDLMLMDIHLGDGKSFNIFEEIQVSSYIIFITAYDEYAIKAFKYNSIDYLLKPLKIKDFEFAYIKFKNQYSSTVQRPGISNLLSQINQKPFKTRFLVRQATMLISVKTGEVAYAYTKDRYHYIKTNSGIDYQIDNNLDELDEQLDPDEYFRVNRQFIVRYSAIANVYAWFDNKIKLLVNPGAYQDIIISRLKATEFKKWLDK
ncbi:MAG: response regulator transcription factor [Sphingobacteriales bacterium]|nr:MAG: response regulator transcription factor [Sphingobacteriales bacterium]